MVPLDENSCRVDYEFYFLNTEGAKAEDFIRQSIQQSVLTQEEDMETCESVQVGLQSGNYEGGRYASRVEQGEFHFHQLLAQSYSVDFVN